MGAGGPWGGGKGYCFGGALSPLDTKDGQASLIPADVPMSPPPGPCTQAERWAWLAQAPHLLSQTFPPGRGWGVGADATAQPCGWPGGEAVLLPPER